MSAPINSDQMARHVASASSLGLGPASSSGTCRFISLFSFNFKQILEFCLMFIMICYETHRQVRLKRSILSFNKTSQNLILICSFSLNTLPLLCADVGCQIFSLFLLFAFFRKLCDTRESNVNQVNPIPSRPSEARQSGFRIHRDSNKLPRESQM